MVTKSLNLSPQDRDVIYGRPFKGNTQKKGRKQTLDNFEFIIQYRKSQEENKDLKISETQMKKYNGASKV
jgi:hypothetical protein